MESFRAAIYKMNYIDSVDELIFINKPLEFYSNEKTMSVIFSRRRFISRDNVNTYE